MEIAPGLLRTRVGELETELVTVPSSAPLTKVVSALREKSAYEVFIVEGSRIGMVSIRDVLMAKNVSKKASSLAVQVPRLSPETEVAEAARLMSEYRIRALPISRGSEATGEITTLSICRALSSAQRLAFTIDKIMTGHPITLDVDDRLGKAKALINRRRIDHLPVRHDGRVVGVLTSQGLLNSLVPPERTMKYGWKPEALVVDQLSVKGLMERPLVCDILDETSSVLKRLIDEGRTCAIVGLGEELQGIVTYRDFVKLLAKPQENTIPVYMVGLPEDPFEAEVAKTKFVRVVNLLRRGFPEILEARSKVKASAPHPRSGRKRYEVETLIYTPRRTFVYSESGWDLPAVFDVISDRLKTIMSRRAKRARIRRTDRGID